MEISLIEYSKLKDDADKSEARRKELEFIINKVKSIKTDLGIDITAIKESDLFTLVPKLLAKKDKIANYFSFINEDYIEKLEELSK